MVDKVEENTIAKLFSGKPQEQRLSLAGSRLAFCAKPQPDGIGLTATHGDFSAAHENVEKVAKHDVGAFLGNTRNSAAFFSSAVVAKNVAQQVAVAQKAVSPLINALDLASTPRMGRSAS